MTKKIPHFLLTVSHAIPVGGLGSGTKSWWEKRGNLHRLLIIALYDASVGVKSQGNKGDTIFQGKKNRKGAGSQQKAKGKLKS